MHVRFTLKKNCLSPPSRSPRLSPPFYQTQYTVSDSTNWQAHDVQTFCRSKPRCLFIQIEPHRSWMTTGCLRSEGWGRFQCRCIEWNVKGFSLGNTSRTLWLFVFPMSAWHHGDWVSCATKIYHIFMSWRRGKQRQKYIFNIWLQSLLDSCCRLRSASLSTLRENGKTIPGLSFDIGKRMDRVLEKVIRVAIFQICDALFRWRRQWRMVTSCTYLFFAASTELVAHVTVYYIRVSLTEFALAVAA